MVVMDNIAFHKKRICQCTNWICRCKYSVYAAILPTIHLLVHGPRKRQQKSSFMRLLQCIDGCTVRKASMCLSCQSTPGDKDLCPLYSMHTALHRKWISLNFYVRVMISLSFTDLDGTFYWQLLILFFHVPFHIFTLKERAVWSRRIKR